MLNPGGLFKKKAWLNKRKERHQAFTWRRTCCCLHGHVQLLLAQSLGLPRTQHGFAHKLHRVSDQGAAVPGSVRSVNMGAVKGLQRGAMWATASKTCNKYEEVSALSKAHPQGATHLPKRPIGSGRTEGCIAAGSTLLRSGAWTFTR
eukprot:scaffold36370_cov21-Tisochrysis_lutea.AAC.1